MTPATLTPGDCDHAFRAMIPDWCIEELDTRLGTTDVVPIVRRAAALGVVTGCDDGPYSKWAMHVNATARGLEVEIIRGHGTLREVVRAGRLTWSNVANRATIAALQRRDADRELQPGEQGRLL